MSAVSTNRYQPPRLRPRRLPIKLWLLFGLLLVIGLVEMTIIFWKLGIDQPAKNQPASSVNETSSTITPNNFDKQRFSINQASSLWVIVNKGRALAGSYKPENLITPEVRLRFGRGSDEMRLRAEAANALEQLFTAAAAEKIFLRLASGYRSYSSQGAIYAREVRTYGQTQADRQSARPGHSEHQTGLAADLAPADGRCEIADCFADTPEGKWLAANAYKYGFIIRYPKGKEDSTGYRYEPWHFRYVGNELAAEIQQTGQTLEQFFDLTVYLRYPSDVYELR